MNATGARLLAAWLVPIGVAVIPPAAAAEEDQRAPLLGPALRPDGSMADVLPPAPPLDSAALGRALDQLAREGAAQDRVARNDPAQDGSAGKDAAPSQPAPGAVSQRSERFDRFIAREGDALSTSLAAYLARLGWDLAWNAPQDFIVQRSYAVDAQAGDMHQMLIRILAPFRLSAVIHNAPAQRVVDIVAADAARDQP